MYEIGDDGRKRIYVVCEIFPAAAARAQSLVMNMTLCDACKVTHKCNYYGLTREIIIITALHKHIIMKTLCSILQTSCRNNQ